MRGRAPRQRKKFDWAGAPKEQKDRRDLGMRKGGAYALYKQVPPGSRGSLLLRGPTYAEADVDQKALRRATAYYGKGDYRAGLRMASRGIGALSGAALGSMSGGGWGGIGAGAQQGWDRGADFSKYMGWGDYGPISRNQIIGESSQAPISVNSDSLSGDIYITRTEFLQNVTATSFAAGSSQFQLVAFPINPGMAQTFPFLSQIANNFTMYSFEGLMFQFKPTSGEYGSSSSNSLGKVIMATQYDPDAPPFASSTEMSNYDYAQSTKPSCGMHHGVETAMSQRQDIMNYVRSGSVNKPLSDTDIGTLYVATEGISFAAAATSIIGELWVSYRVRLSRAKLSSQLGNQIQDCILEATHSASALVSAVTGRRTNSSLECTLTNVSSQAAVITFPRNIVRGTYRVLVQCSSLGLYTNQAWNSVNGFLNCLPYNISDLAPNLGATILVLQSSNCSFPSSPAGTTANGSIAAEFYVLVQAPGSLQAQMQVNLTTGLASAGSFRVVITQVADGFGAPAPVVPYV